jgi:hypothetical protein
MRVKTRRADGWGNFTSKDLRFLFEVIPQSHIQVKHVCGEMILITKFHFEEIEGICPKCDRYVRLRLEGQYTQHEAKKEA